MKQVNRLIFTIMCLLGLSFLSIGAQAQQVTGQVLAAKSGEGLPGVTVSIKGTSQGTITDVNGNYTLTVKDPKAVLVFSYVGYTTQEISLNGQSTLTINLDEDSQQLEEIVVIGYGEAKKSDLTGAVSSVKPEELTQLATPDVAQALQGRAAGVSVISNSGEPGSGVRVRIRGTGTINSSDPLYVVDGFQTGNISFLNPNDIQSIEVLKDASATAIYGSRGANGVVLITTKRGQSGPTRFTFESYVGFQKAWRQVDMLNATDYSTLRLEAYSNDGVVLPADDDELVRLSFVQANGYRGTNWQDEVMQTGLIQNYSLSAQGGSEKNRFSFTATYFGQEGIVLNSDFKKLTFRLNDDVKINNWLNAGVSVAYSHTDKTFYNGDLFNGVLTSALRADPITPAFDEPTNNWGRADISFIPNPARIATELANNKGHGDLINGVAYLEATIIKGLKNRAQIGVTQNKQRFDSFFPEFFVATDERRDVSTYTERVQEQIEWVFTDYLQYTRDFGRHTASLMAGFEAQQIQSDNFSITGFGVPNNADLFSLASVTEEDFNVTVNPGQLFDRTLMSVFGRLNYGYDDRYLLTATVRYDGSSKFLSDKRWGLFPSFAASWNVHNEDFMEDISLISTLKLRGGWGKVGNQNSAQDYGYVTTLSGGSLYVFGETPSVVQGFAAINGSNPELQWETSTSWNVGLDVGLWQGALSLTADYFVRDTDDMIVQVPVPVYSGIGPPRVNAGSMRNQGLELALSYQGSISDFKYEIGAIFSKIDNEVRSLGGGEAIASGNITKVGNSTLTTVGREIASYYGLITDGIFNDADELAAHALEGSPIQPQARVGDVKFVDLNGDGQINEDDRTYLGSATPDFTYNFTLNMEYKGFDLRLFFQGVEGNEIINGLEYYTANSNGKENSTADRINRWTPENPNTDQPRMTISDPNQNFRFSDRHIQDGSYLRLKNLTFGYTFPKNLISKIRLQSARIYFAADNLFTITDYDMFDPEIGEFSSNPLQYGLDFGNYPQPRTFRFGMNVGF